MMRKELLIIVLLLMAVVSMEADDGLVELSDSVGSDGKQWQKVQQKIKYTIREFDRLDKEYIEPQHYEFSVMLQATRNYADFILSSNGQSIMFSPDQPIRLGPY